VCGVRVCGMSVWGMSVWVWGMWVLLAFVGLTCIYSTRSRTLIICFKPSLFSDRAFDYIIILILYTYRRPWRNQSASCFLQVLTHDSSFGADSTTLSARAAWLCGVYSMATGTVSPKTTLSRPSSQSLRWIHAGVHCMAVGIHKG